MAIAPAGAAYKSLTFDNKTSREFGVYITGEAVYNAPEREVEMITIPGRNGAFALDKGRFENIPVKYPAGIFGETEADFRTAISDFRNFLCSKQGYCRLTDDYNPNEFRKAVYKSGLEVEPALLRAGEFEILFDAMPQRYLTSGETKQTIASSGDTITNPTLFDSKPLLEVEGYGAVGIGNQVIEINNDLIGDIVVIKSEYDNGKKTLTATFDDTYANTGDAIRVGEMRYTGQFWKSHTGGSISHSGDANGSEFSDRSTNTFALSVMMTDKQFTYGTATTLTGAATGAVVTSDYGTLNVVVNMSVVYDGADEITITITTTIPSQITEWGGSLYPIIIIQNVILESSQYAIGNPLYIDLDIGEAYKIESGSVVSVNNAVQMPAELPALAPGSNTITFDNTITSLKITPRWWKL